MKEAWTADLERILWEQALKNRGEVQREEEQKKEISSHSHSALTTL